MGKKQLTLNELIDLTPQEVFEYKQGWKPGIEVNVHSDLHIQCKQWARDNLNRWEWSMDAYTDVYSHTFYFQWPAAAERFRQKFAEWVDKGKH